MYTLRDTPYYIMLGGSHCFIFPAPIPVCYCAAMMSVAAGGSDVLTNITGPGELSADDGDVPPAMTFESPKNTKNPAQGKHLMIGLHIHVHDICIAY